MTNINPKDLNFGERPGDIPRGGGGSRQTKPTKAKSKALTLAEVEP